MVKNLKKIVQQAVKAVTSGVNFSYPSKHTNVTAQHKAGTFRVRVELLDHNTIFDKLSIPEALALSIELKQAVEVADAIDRALVDYQPN